MKSNIENSNVRVWILTLASFAICMVMAGYAVENNANPMVVISIFTFISFFIGSIVQFKLWFTKFVRVKQ
jgi:hypothetical protein